MAGGTAGQSASGVSGTNPQGTGGTSSGSGGTSGAGSSNGGASGSVAGSAGSAGRPALGDGPGIACDQAFTVEDSELKGCIATVAGVKLKFFPLAATTAVKHVAVFLHGDTAADWHAWYPFLVDTVEWCKARDILVVAPLSPVTYDDDPPDEPSYGAASETEAESVGQALEEFLDAYAASRQGLLYWGMSGGSWFATSSFIPLFGARLPGAYALSCGASEFWADYAWDTAGPERAQNKLLFNYGSEDFLKDGEEASAEKFGADGFNVSVTTHPGAEHCDHPIHEPTTQFWATTL